MLLRRMVREQQEELRRIGALIARLRKSRGLTQEQLARRMGIGTSTVSRWERGLHKGEPVNVRKLADALGIEASVLLPTEPTLESQLDRIERKLSRQGQVLDALKDAFEVYLALGVEPGAARALQPGSGRTRAADRPARG